MTIAEKAMQLSCLVPLALLDRKGLMRDQADALIKPGIGHVAGIGLLGRKPPETIAEICQCCPALPGHRNTPRDPGNLLQRAQSGFK